MRKLYRTTALIGLASTIAGCTQFTTYNRPRLIDGKRAQATYLDAKQRLVYSSPAYDDQLHGKVLKFCAEPSPDALSALAASGSAGLSEGDKVTLQAAMALSEQAGSIGLRTQSIQLMRDSMFRLCEASLSHNTSPQFWSAFRYFQNSMVTILAIEQLTGITRAPSLQLSTNASATPSKEIATLTDSLAKAKATLATDQADTATKKNTLDAAEGKAADYLKQNSADAEDKLPSDKVDGYKPLKQAVVDAKKANEDAAAKVTGDQKLVDAYQTSIGLLAPALAASGTATSSTAEAAATGQTAVANAVQAIVLEQLRGGFLRQTCATLYDQELAAGQEIAPNTALHRNCDIWANRTAMGKLDPGGNAALTDTTQLGPNGSFFLSANVDRPIDILIDPNEKSKGATANPKPNR